MIEPIGGHGGMEIYDFGLCRAMARNGIEVTLYTCIETTLDKQMEFEFSVKKVFQGIYGQTNVAQRGIRYLLGLLYATLDAKRKGVQIVHFHIFHHSLIEYLTLLVCKLLAFRVVVTVHDAESFDSREMGNEKKKFYRLIDRVVVHNDFVRNSITSFSFCSAEGIEVVTHGDFDDFFDVIVSREEARKRLSIDYEGSLLLFFGQIKQAKGLDIALKALAFLAKEKMRS